VRIQLMGSMESPNISVSAGICLLKAGRQRLIFELSFTYNWQ